MTSAKRLQTSRRRRVVSESRLGRGQRLFTARNLQMLGMAYCIWRPVSHSTILYPVIAIIFSTSLLIIVRERLTIPRWLVTSTLLILCAASLGAAVGGFRGNPGVMQQSIQWLLAPIVWATFAASQTRRSARQLMLVAVVATGVSLLLMFSFFGSRLGIPVTLPSFVTSEQGAGLSTHDGSTAIRWYGLSSLAAGAPMVLTAAVQGPDRWLPRRAIIVATAVLAVIVSVSAGRRAVLLTVLLAFVLLPLLRKRSSKSDITVPALTLLGTSLVGMIFLARPSLLTRGVQAIVRATSVYLGTSTDPYLSQDDAARAEGAKQLLGAFLQDPILGHGLGAVIPGFSRNEERPWTFELQLHLGLMNLGIVGAAMVVIAMLIWVRVLRRALKEQPEHSASLNAAAMGCLGMAVANLTNPYLQAVGHGWSVAISVGLICALSRGVKDEPYAALPHAVRASIAVTRGRR